MHEILPVMIVHVQSMVCPLFLVHAFVSSKPICKHSASPLAIMVVVVECVL